MVLRKLSQSFKITLALMLSVLSSGILQVAPVFATGTLLPVWCQVTGAGWKAQQGTGDNTQRFPLMGEQSALYGVVTTENSSLYSTAVIGQTLWKDSSGQIDNLNDACEDQYSSVTPAAPTIKADPCGTTGDMYTIPSKIGVTYKVGGDTKTAGDYPTNGALSVTVTATADKNFVLTGTSSWTLTFTNASCITTINNPELPEQTIVCGPENDSLAITTLPNITLASDSGWVSWVNGTSKRTLVWTANSGFIFQSGLSTHTQIFNDNNTVCPPTEITLPTPAKTDPCGLNNAYWNEAQPAVGHVIWTLEEDGDLIATISGNYTFPGSETSHNFGKAIDSNTPCPVTKPAAPAVTDPCGLANATWTSPSDTTELDWSLVDGMLSVQTKAGYEFTDHTTLITFGAATDGGALCNATAENVTYIDVCGTANDTFTVPSTANVIYKVGDTVTPADTYPGIGTVTVIASAEPNYQLTTPYVFEYEFDNASCEKVTICHRDNNVKRPYVKIEVAQSAVDGIAGNNGKGQPDHYGEHTGPLATSETAAQILKDAHIEWGDIIPPVEDVHDGNANWTALGIAMYNNDCNFVSSVTPEAPMIVDLCYDDTDSILIPSTNGVIYKVNGVIVAAGTTVEFTGTPLIVTAEAKDKSYLLTGYTGPWTFDENDFSDEQCLSIAKTADPLTDTNGDGRIGVGDKIYWTITVTNNGDRAVEQFSVQVSDENATIEGKNYIERLEAGDKFVVKAYTTITTAHVGEVCKVTNTAGFGANYYTENELSRLFNSPVLEDEEYDFTGASNNAEATFTCPTTPGRVLGEQAPPTPGKTLSASTVLPAMLPATGAKDSPYMILVAALIAYGATYFIQGRRKLLRNEA